MPAVTLRDIARQAEVSVFTVSCALRGHARVAAATRERVRELAERLGYRPDPSAVTLAARQRRSRVANLPFDLAYLRQRFDEASMQAFAAACAELGYGARGIWPEEMASAEVLSRSLWQQGVQGILFSGDGAAGGLLDLEGFDWSRFSVVKLTRSMESLPFDHVRHSDFGYARMVLREVFRRGARRVAVLLTRSTSPTDNDARLGAVLSWKAQHLPRGCWLGWKQTETTESGPAVVEWLRRTGPDVVVGFPWSWYWHLGGAGFRIPEEIRFAGMIAPGPVRPWLPIAGCDERQTDMVRQGVQMLHHLVVSGQRGFPAQPKQAVIEPVWRDGASLGGSP